MTTTDFAAVSSRQLLEYALLLIARQHGGDAAAAQAAQDELARWRHAAPANEAAAQAAWRGWAATEAGGLQGAMPLPPTQAERDAHHQRTRRRVLSALGLAGLVVAAGGGGRWYWQQPLAQVALRTGHGELLSHRLQDGSQLDLAPGTVAEATLYRDRRELRLAQGEVRLEVQPDAGRPFEVLTDWGRVRVLGTAFTVAVRDRRMSVAVAHGRVAVWAARPGGTATQPPDAELTAGQTVQTTVQGLGDIGTVAAGDVGAWRQGWLVFDRTPLPEVVARWNDYLAQPLVLAADQAAALRELRLTGSFPLRDPAGFIASLPHVLPVQVERAEQGTQQGAQTLRMRR